MAETLEQLLAIVREVDAHLDANTAEPYRLQPLAGHWARVTKVCEEAGEVWKALSKATGENPRKGVCGTWDELLEELGDTASAALCAIQHITKDEARTAAVFIAALEKAHRRVGEFAEEGAAGRGEAGMTPDARAMALWRLGVRIEDLRPEVAARWQLPCEQPPWAPS